MDKEEKTIKTLQEVLAGIPHRLLGGREDLPLAGLSFDSRAVVPSGAFVAIEGTAADGHDYIDQAIRAGACAVVLRKTPGELHPGVTYVQVEDTSRALALMARAFYDNPTSRIALVGVTGTNGKTTTATLLYQVFRSMGYRCGLFSTVENILGEEHIPARQTTPDILTLNASLDRMARQGCTHCFMEVSSHALAQQRVAGLDFRGAIFSNLTHDHLDYHKTFAGYRDAKKRLFDSLAPDAFALVNADDRNGAYMLPNTRAHKYTYSLASVSDFKARILESTFEGMELEIDGRQVWLPLVGRFNAYNALAIYATAVLLGCEPTRVLEALSCQRGVHGRFENWTSPSGVVCIVDYAHTPDALDNVIRTVNQLRTGNETFTVVAGCGGDRDRTKRPEMAAIVAEGADRAIFTSDNPRSEDPMDILEEMMAGVPAERTARVLVNPDRRQAIRTAVAMARKGDIILVAGKGHETYQEVKGVRTHFDDMEQLREAFSASAAEKR